MEQPKLINNISERVVDDLKQRLSKDTRVSIAAASFSIYAFEALKEELEKIEELRFIFTSPTFIKDKTKKEKREFFIPKLNRERNLYGTDFEIRLRNQLSQKAIAKECANWIRRKVKFRSNASQDPIWANTNPDWAVAFREGSVKHVYFVAETKGNDIEVSQLRRAEDAKIECARRHFAAISTGDVVYNVVKTYQDLYNAVTK